MKQLTLTYKTEAGELLLLEMEGSVPFLATALKKMLVTADIPISAPLSFVTEKGVVRVPDAIREKLGLMDGGGVAFVTNEAGRVEMLSDEQLYALAEGEENDALR